jgi:hypothetical protein
MPDLPAQVLANPLTAAVQTRYRSIRQNLVEAAELMPADAYAFRLTPPQRTFAEWLTHTAMSNYGLCAAMKCDPAPDTAHLGKLTAKPEIEEALRKSFESCDAVLNGMTDEKALAPFRRRDTTLYPVDSMIGLIAMLNGHYGNLVGYLRSKGITPPSSTRQTRPLPVRDRIFERKR